MGMFLCNYEKSPQQNEICLNPQPAKVQGRQSFLTKSMEDLKSDVDVSSTFNNVNLNK